jgi:hypothetical protein
MGNNYYKVLFLSKPVNLIARDVVVLLATQEPAATKICFKDKWN